MADLISLTEASEQLDHVSHMSVSKKKKGGREGGSNTACTCHINVCLQRNVRGGKGKKERKKERKKEKRKTENETLI